MSPYEILGVGPTATTEEIRSAYRKQALKYHPDRNPGNKEAEKKFKAISEAYDILANPEKRRFYDLHGAAAASGASGARGPEGFGGDLDRIFEMMGAVFGSSIFKDVKQPKAKSGKKKPCPSCKGEGMVGSDLGFFMFKIVCPKCFGSGRIV